MPDFNSLPPHLRHDPHMVDLRLTRLEKMETDRHAPHVQSHPHIMDILAAIAAKEVKTPFGNLPLGVAAFGAGLYIWQPQFVSRLIGAVWPS